MLNGIFFTSLSVFLMLVLDFDINNILLVLFIIQMTVIVIKLISIWALNPKNEMEDFYFMLLDCKNYLRLAKMRYLYKARQWVQDEKKDDLEIMLKYLKYKVYEENN